MGMGNDLNIGVSGLGIGQKVQQHEDGGDVHQPGISVWRFMVIWPHGRELPLGK